MVLIERLTGSLQVDSSRIRAVSGWAPPFSLDQGLAETADWYRTVVAKRR
jgi:UDP-glucose 4-epimerase